jgi:hypothetical protein
MNNVIGLETTYHGDEHRYLHGYKVRIVAVLKGSAAPHDDDFDADYLTDDVEIARAGGVTAGERIEVQPWLEQDGRYSFVTSDPRAVDLAAFSNLAS